MAPITTGANPIMLYTVKRTGRTWSVFCNGILIEGGFFAADAARECARRYNAEANRTDRSI
jgi:hypothetical protein